MDRANILFQAGNAMSSIPFNTVASVMGTGTVARQLATVQDKKLQEQIRGQHQVATVSRTSQEEVHDPGDNDVQHVHDDDRRGADQEPQHDRRKAEEQVEIPGIEIHAEATATPPPFVSRLDISA